MEMDMFIFIVIYMGEANKKKETMMFYLIYMLKVFYTFFKVFFCFF